MTISSTNKLFFCFLLLMAGAAFSQDNTTVFWRPVIAVNYDVLDDYSHNFALANQNFIYSENDLNISVSQLQIIHFSRFRVADNQRISLGIQWRNSKIFDGDSFNEFRITEEYNLRYKPRVLRYGHRFRVEQRLSSRPTVHRFRYRIAIDFPLVGANLDVGESYAVLGIENLLSVGKSRSSSYAIRFRGGIGWRLSLKTNLQFLLEYQLRDYTHSSNHVVLFETLLNLSL